jgi:hypothetical protein
MCYADVRLYDPMYDRNVGAGAMVLFRRSVRGTTLHAGRAGGELGLHVVDGDITDLIRIACKVCEKQNITPGESRLHRFTDRHS